jgi:hypothetical protein
MTTMATIGISIVVEPTEIAVYDHQPFIVFHVKVHTVDSIWEALLTSRDSLNTFIQGVKCGAAASGRFDVTVEEIATRKKT